MACDQRSDGRHDSGGSSRPLPRPAVGSGDTSNLARCSLETAENKSPPGPPELVLSSGGGGTVSSREIAGRCYQAVPALETPEQRSLSGDNRAGREIRGWIICIRRRRPQ